MEQIGIGQLHWSTANYQPLQERALWDGLVALYNEVHHLELMSVMKLAGLFSTRMFTVPEGAKQKQWTAAMHTAMHQCNASVVLEPLGVLKCQTQAVLERQDLSCKYLAHYEAWKRWITLNITLKHEL